MKQTNHNLSLETAEEPYKRKISFIIFLIILLEIIGTLTYHHIEGWTYLEAVYFSTVTLTTVGYGDITPKTDLGRIVTIFYAIFGIGIVLYGLSTVSAHFIEQREKEFIRNISGIVSRKPTETILNKIKKVYKNILQENDKTKKGRSYRSK